MNTQLTTRRASRRWPIYKSLIAQKAPQLPASARVLQLAQRLPLDLHDAFAGDRELLADLFEGVVGVHADAHAQYAIEFYSDPNCYLK